MKDQFYKYIERLQDRITSTIEELDGAAKFNEDIWKRDEGGGGKTRVIENGAVFEKGGVNISACLLYTSPSPRDATLSRMPSSA